MKTIKCIIIALLAGLLAVLPGIQPAQAARTLNGTSDYIEAGSAVVTAEPLTMACWFKPTGTAVGSVLITVVKNGVNPDRFTLGHNLSGGQCRINSNDDGVASGSATAGTPSSGSWGHFAGVVASSSSRTAYYNGSAGTTDTTAVTITGVNRTIVGASYSGSYSSFSSGDIADAAIWNVVLSADEISSLAKGFSPRLVRPQSLVFYAPAVRSVTDIRGGVALTDTVPTTAASSHPPVRN